MELKIKNLERDKETGLVKVIHYKLEAGGKEIYGSCGLPKKPDANDFIPFEQLTEEQLLIWLRNELGKNKSHKVTVSEENENGELIERVVEEIVEESQLQKLEQQLLDMIDKETEKLAQGLPF